jgi:hypothetical protein
MRQFKTFCGSFFPGPLYTCVVALRKICEVAEIDWRKFGHRISFLKHQRLLLLLNFFYRLRLHSFYSAGLGNSLDTNFLFNLSRNPMRLNNLQLLL